MPPPSRLVTSICLVLTFGYRGSNRVLDKLRQRFALLKHAFEFKSEIGRNTDGWECGCFHGFIVLQVQCKTNYSKRATESLKADGRWAKLTAGL